MGIIDKKMETTFRINLWVLGFRIFRFRGLGFGV